jgi:aspartate kinase
MLSYEESQEMAEAGAKVLNAQAVEFAKDKGIAIYARATASPLPGADPSEDGTVVRRDAVRPAGAVVGVASERDVLVLHVDGGADLVLALLDQHNVEGKQLHRAGDSLTLVISRENLHEEGRLRAALSARFGGKVRLLDTLGAVSAIGSGINASFDNLRRGTAALAGAGIVAGHVATSSFRITWMVDRARLHDAVRVLHATYIESRSG